MKYSHIIYNSSQTNREGRPGFGVRAVTSGTDPNLLAALEDADIYSFNYSHPRLNSNSLASDPTLIRLIEPSYFFTSVESGNVRTWVLGRKIAVGFDYMFYANGNPTRLGNYVADLYCFDSVPDRQVFRILYENPAPGSAHFIPTSPEPNADNIEMSAISLGQPHDMSPEDRVFDTAELPEIDPRAVKLLFAFFAHLSDGKPVAAIIGDKEAPKVMASFMRIVPEEVISRATFVTNYNETGVPKGYAIACVDPENASDYMPMVWNIVNLTDPADYRSVESSHLSGEFAKALKDKDITAVMNLSRWLFSKEYRAVKDMDETAREISFRYVFAPDSVNDSILGKALDGDASVKALAKLCEAGANTAILDKYFDAKIASAKTVRDVKAVIDKLLALEKKGLACAGEALKRHSSGITAIVLADAGSLEEFFSLAGAVGKESLAPYAGVIDLESLKGKRNSFLSGLTPASWRKLYSLFFPIPVDEKKLVSRSVTDRLPEGERSAFLLETVSPERLVKVAVALMLENDDFSGALLPVLRQLQDRGITAGERYFDIFKSKRDNAAFADLMCNEYIKSLPLTPVENEVERIVQLAAHPTLVGAVSDNKLSSLLSSLKSEAASDTNKKKVTTLCASITALPLKSRMLPEFQFLADTLEGKYSNDALKTALLGVDIENTKVVTDQMDALVKTRVDAKDIAKIVAFLSDKGIERAELLTTVLPAPGKSLPGWIAALYARENKKRGVTVVTELLNAGLTQDEAVAVLAETFPEDHKAYLKSLQPNLFTRFAGWVKSLFNKKPSEDKSDDKENAEKKPAEKKPAQTDKPSRPTGKKQKEKKQGRDVKKSKPAEEKPAVAAEPEAVLPAPEPVAETLPVSQPEDKLPVPEPEIADRTEIPAAASDYTHENGNEEDINLA